MKIILSITCALFLLGCSESGSKAPSTEVSSTPVVENNLSTPEASAPPTTTTQQPSTTVAEKPTAPTATAVDAGALFGQKCVSCHGAKGEKAALGKSQIIATFSESQIKDALKGYQAGTYGKEMKAVMQGQAKALDDAQIDALAKHISAF
ncbi:MAG: c-type cytochrome [Sulfuricurvum sp.]|uniref:c-type cytochrome n=1 Tax=Sulfuricurvum sp. TaxID=2025608 RepID=UPI002625A1FC|nr:c-type cytochrome [Sulfuricurvum sp.]MDD2829333.1 c-type cytochrome [Sulfuricurvum sp.]MDD4948650.1 c-type cytochrome [Sulfuricurvum sp.]